MAEFPKNYELFLSSLGPEHAEALRPVFLESVEEGEFGVHVRGAGSHHVQAFVDENVPFGEVLETKPRHSP